MQSPMPLITRAWAMPSPATFSIPPISALLDHWLVNCAIIIDPFSGDSLRGTLRNDLRHGVEATEWLQTLDVQADAVLFDPPYFASSDQRGLQTCRTGGRNA